MQTFSTSRRIERGSKPLRYYQEQNLIKDKSTETGSDSASQFLVDLKRLLNWELQIDTEIHLLKQRQGEDKNRDKRFPRIRNKDGFPFTVLNAADRSVRVASGKSGNRQVVHQAASPAEGGPRELTSGQSGCQAFHPFIWTSSGQPQIPYKSKLSCRSGYCPPLTDQWVSDG